LIVIAVVADASMSGMRQDLLYTRVSIVFGNWRDPVLIRVTGDEMTRRNNTRDIAPAVSVVPIVMDWIDRIPLSPAARLKRTKVPITAVAGKDIVPVLHVTPTEFVYDIVIFATTAAFVVAVVTRIPASTPSPLVDPFVSRAGRVGVVIACAVVVVTTSPLFTHKKSKRLNCPVTVDDISASRIYPEFHAEGSGKYRHPLSVVVVPSVTLPFTHGVPGVHAHGVPASFAKQ
jgi:hypothetical protein